MFCHSCGRSLADGLRFCDACGVAVGAGGAAIATPPAGAASGGPAAKEIGEQLKTSSKDALDVLKHLLANPVGGLPAAFVNLGPDRALGAGIALCVVFALATAWGVVMGASQIGQMLGFFGAFMGGSPGFGGFLKIALQLLVLPAAIAAVSLGLRKVVGATAPVAADVFTAGAALVPMGLATLLGGLIGVGNAEVVLLMFFFAFVYLILMLYTGFTRVGGMSERAGAPAVPVALLLAGWVCKVIFASFV